MPPVKDMTGERFGMLTVLHDVERPPNKNRRGRYWLCRCDCGREVIYIGKVLRRGEVKSCGYCTNSRPIDETGNRYGRLVVLEKTNCHRNSQYWWRCICDCGNEVIVPGYRLRNGTTKSCGCFGKEHAVLMGKAKRTHGHSRTPLYSIWIGMKERCFNENNWAYSYYGGRGVTICDEWRNDFSAFYEWAIENGYDETAPSRQCTLDRINNSGNYEPSNCRWVGTYEQANNRRDNRRLVFNGVPHTFTELASITGLPRELIRGRFYRGWSTDEIFNTPYKQKRNKEEIV